MHLVLDRRPGVVRVTRVDTSGRIDGEPENLVPADLPRWVIAHEAPDIRWVWDDTRAWYPEVLAAGGRVAKCIDLRLAHRLLQHAAATAGTAYVASSHDGWDADSRTASVPQREATLFDEELIVDRSNDDRDPVAELIAQLDAIRSSTEPGALRLLVAAECAGALAAAEMQYAGLPWRADVHERILASLLGPRVQHGVRPVALAELAAQIRVLLDDPELNPDSPTDLLRSLRRAGMIIDSTRKHVLAELNHPAIAPILEYKRRARLHSANGWSWLDEWVVDGRFHPEYVVGGVVSGRWAASGGGALQLPKQVRSAVVADPGWTFVVADVAQLEPRVLAAMASDLSMAAAGHGRDLYDGVVATGAVATRQQAKGAMLGAMYGATQGEGGRLVPRLMRAFPRALALVESAARAGERGEAVRSLLGRTAPTPGAEWAAAQARAFAPDGTPAAERAARGRARSWGRFTRNFVVQATAAEWALSWIAGIRTRLAARVDGWVGSGPHLVFFLHDEVVVHTPNDDSAWVAEQVTAAANDAGRLLFGDFPIDFPLSVAIVDDYGSAKE